MRQGFFFILLMTAFLLSCSKKHKEVEPIYTPEEFQTLTANLTTVNPTGENAIPFHEYSPKVNKLISKTFVYERLRFYAIGFDSVEDAREEAKRLNQYYSHNFMFDQVEGEPVLEDYVITQFKAMNPNRTVQRIPKKHEASHGNPHGETAPAHH